MNRTALTAVALTLAACAACDSHSDDTVPAVNASTPDQPGRDTNGTTPRQPEGDEAPR